MSHKRALLNASAEHASDSESDDMNYDDATNDSDLNGDTSEEEVFFFFFYEWEHRTGTMCPFSSLYPSRNRKE